MIEYISIAFIILIIGLLIYALKNALNKIEAYEQFIKDRRAAYIELLQNLRDIDSRELFEKDDDVGTTFTELKNEIESFKNILD
jgi:hypothetical protein